jgi:hypothetical protein
MVETELVTEDIANGERAVKALDEEQAGVRSAFWFYDRDAVEYRLVLALPVVDREGPEIGYKLTQRAFIKHDVRLPLRRVVVVGVSEPLPTILHRALGEIRDSDAITIRARLGRQVVDGLTIEDAYVYRST